MNGLDLFSGIGGLSLALRHYVRPVCYVESDPFCQTLLRERMQDGDLPEAPIWDDVRTFDAKPWRRIVDCIYGGWPCQDISVAGRGAGLAGQRSGLFFEMLRIIDECEPRFVFVENVPAIRTRGLATVGRELARRGYDLRWTTLSAADVGAPHLRRRWFCLAAHTDRGSLRNMRGGRSGKSGNGSSFPLVDGSHGAVADTCGAGLAIRQGVAEHTLQKLEAPFRACWWAAEPNVGRVAVRAPGRVDKLRALGNAVVPLQARTAFEHLSGLCA